MNQDQPSLDRPTNQPIPCLVNETNDERIALDRRLVTVGSATECAVRIRERGIDSFAVQLVYDHGTYYVEPIGSSTRVTHNGKRLRDRRALAPGDRICLGGQCFRFVEPRADDAPGAGGKTHGPLRQLITAVVSLIDNREQDLSFAVVSHISRLLGSDAARLVIEDEGSGRRRTLACFPADAPAERFSSRAIDWARDENRTVLMHDIDWRELHPDSSMASLETNRIASVLCAPLTHAGNHLGYLYLDRLQGSSPFDSADRDLCDALAPLFAVILSNAHQSRNQREAIARLQRKNLASGTGLVYESETMHAVIREAQTFAKTEAPVLIQGETGTGKELMAHFIHEQSRRTGKPFRAINCGAIPENLIESELFGYEKGAFTGAAKRTAGLFESADGGTVLLDEIGELPLQVQVKLLRVLQESEITRLGGHDPLAVDVRIIAATNKQLSRCVEQGAFRRDLFFRLNVLMLTLPPLRERSQDLLLLAETFVENYCSQFGLPRKRLTPEAHARLSSYSWPGNVRELQNCIQKAVLLSSGTRIAGDEISYHAHSTGEEKTGEQAVRPLKEIRSEAERAGIEHALTVTEGNVSLASRMLQIDRAWLTKRIDSYGIDVSGFRKG